MALALLWKNRGLTSHACLREFKKTLGLGGGGRDIGHSGTLDPFAEGLLLCGVGEGTKLLAPLGGLPKTYCAQMILGATSSSFDDSGEISFFEDMSGLHAKLAPGLAEFLATQVGKHEQVPPALSAIHIDGKRSYEWAREGVTKELKARQIEIFSAQHISLEPGAWRGRQVLLWNFEIKVSAGTYIRSFARDWALTLCGWPGLLSQLKRTEVGPFRWRFEGGQKFQWLDEKKLEALFETKVLATDEAVALESFGRWVSSAGNARARLLCAPSGKIIAWTQAQTDRIGRVFREDPLKIPSGSLISAS